MAAIYALLRGDVKGAIAEASVGVGPGYKPVLDYAAANYALKNPRDFEPAVEMLESVASGPPGVFDTRPAALVLLGTTYHEHWISETDPAKKEEYRSRSLSAFTRLLRLWTPDLYQTYINTKYCADLDDVSLAHSYFVMLREFAPDHPETGHMHTWLLYRQEDYRGAAEACRRYLELRPDDKQLIDRLGEALKHLPPEEQDAKRGQG